jgi:hypothetical protein
MQSLQLAGSALLAKNRAFFGVPRLFAGHQASSYMPAADQHGDH